MQPPDSLQCKCAIATFPSIVLDVFGSCIDGLQAVYIDAYGT